MRRKITTGHREKMEGIGDGRKDERDVKGKGRMGIIV